MAEDNFFKKMLEEFSIPFDRVSKFKHEDISEYTVYELGLMATVAHYEKENHSTLKKILKTLESMKQQEHDYWEAWKKAKDVEDK